MRELPLSRLHQQAGAVMQPWQEWTVPWRFRQAQAEYQAVRQSCGLIDWSVTETLSVSGADRVGFLHNLLSNDIRRLQPGDRCQAALLAPNAKLVAQLIVLAEQDQHLLLTLGTRVSTVIQTLERYRIVEEVRVEEPATPVACLALQGPSSESVLAQTLRVTGTGPDRHGLAELDSVPVRWLHHTITGRPGFLLLVDGAQAPALWKALARHATPVGWEALNALRIEAGIPWHGLDMDNATLLSETGLERDCVSFTKGCYVGQEVIARLETYGSVSRKLMGLVVEDQRVPVAEATLMRASEAIGTVTSAAFSFGLNRAIALAYVKRPHYSQPGPVELLHDTARVPARLIPLPFDEAGQA